MEEQKLYAVVELPEDGGRTFADVSENPITYPCDIVVLLYNEDISRLITESAQGYLSEMIEMFNLNTENNDTL